MDKYISSPQSPLSLERLLFRFRTRLHMPNTGPLEILLGAYAANVLPGDPVWLMIVAPPSAGKTELFNPLGGLPHVHAASTLTEAALLSGTSKHDKASDATGGLLKEMGDFGILLLKDFTSILSMSRDKRTGLLAALREIYDGSWTRHLGVDGGVSLPWSGKMGLLAGVTQAIDSHHGVMGEMGPRFLLCRLPRVNAQRQAERALNNSDSGREAEARAELCESVKVFFAGLDLSGRALCPISVDEKKALTLMAVFVSHSRSAVERDARSREITNVLQPEAPARLVKSAGQLLAGMKAIGVAPPRALRLVTKVLKDCIPPVRRAALDWMMTTDCAPGTILESTGLPKSTLTTAINDLKSHGVVIRTATGWEIAESWSEHLAVAYPEGMRREAKLGKFTVGPDDA